MSEEKQLQNIRFEVEVQPTDAPRFYADFVLVQYKGTSVGLEFVDTRLISEQEKEVARKGGTPRLVRKSTVSVVLPPGVAYGLYKALEDQLSGEIAKLKKKGVI